jgi:hypothetical protein
MIFFSEDTLLFLINNFSELSEIINQYGGNSKLAIKQLEESLIYEAPYRDDYYFKRYSLEAERSHDRRRLIKKCMKNANRNNRLEINVVDITLSVLDIHDEGSPIWDNGTFTDTRFHTPYNTISHVAGFYSEYLWVKTDDIRRELSYLNI